MLLNGASQGIVSRNPFFIRASFQTDIERMLLYFNYAGSRNPFFIRASFQTIEQTNYKFERLDVVIPFSSGQAFRLRVIPFESTRKQKS